MDILTENEKAIFWGDFVAGAIAGIVAIILVSKLYKSKKEDIVEGVIITANELVRKKQIDASDVVKAANVVAKRQHLGGEFYFDNGEIVFLKPHI